MKDDKLLEERLMKAWSGLEKKGGGVVQFKTYFLYRELIPLIENLISSADNITEREKGRLIQDALVKCKHDEKENVVNFNKFYRLFEKELLQIPQNKYYLTTKLSIAGSHKGKGITKIIDDVRISINTRTPKGLDTSEFFVNGLGYVDPSAPIGYCNLHASVYARSEHSAGKKILKSVSKFLAAINFQTSNYNHIVSGRVVPHNRVRLGQYQALHDARGKRVDDYVWYTPDYHEQPHLISSDNFMKNYHPNAEQLLKMIQKTPSKEIAWQCLELYNSANNASDQNTTLMRLWSALEILTGTTDRPAKITAERASFLFRNPHDVKDFLIYVAHIRNKAVHLGQDYEFIEHLLGGLRRYTRSLLRAFLYAKPPFTNHQEFLEVIDQSSDAAALKRKILIAKIGLHWKLSPENR